MPKRAQKPFTFLEQQWAAGWSNSNNLIRGATQTNYRQNVNFLDYDTNRTISNIGRRVLMSIGRYLYWNCTPVRGAIDDIPRYAVSSWVPKFRGKDKAWGEAAKEYLLEHDKHCDLRGHPYSMDILLSNLVRETIIDGDFGVLMTQDELGVPKLQTWRASRIGNRLSTSGVVSGSDTIYDGMKIVDGVIVDDYARTVAFGLLGEIPWTDPLYYASASDFILSFIPSFADQTRGISLLGASVFDWQDVNESRQFQLIAQKIEATFGMQIMNEEGAPDRTKSLLADPATAPDAVGNANDLPAEVHKPGKVMYFKAGTGQKVAPIDTGNRPSAEFMQFQDEIIRGALESLGWSFDFSHKPGETGGAAMRVVIEKICARVGEIQRCQVKPFRLRVDGWRIARAIKAGLLPENDEWFKWGYTAPSKVTADRKYDSEIDLEESARGVITEEDVCARRGHNREDVYRQRELETEQKWAAAQRIAEKFQIGIEEAFDSMWKIRESPVQQQAQEQGQE